MNLIDSVQPTICAYQALMHIPDIFDGTVKLRLSQNVISDAIEYMGLVM